MRRVNHFPDPMFAHPPASTSPKDMSVSTSESYGVTQLIITKLSDRSDDMNIVSEVHGLDAGGRYVFACDLWCGSSGGYVNNMPVSITDGKDSMMLASAKDHTDVGSFSVRLNFTAPDDGMIRLKFRPLYAANSTVTVKRPNIELADTFDSLIPFFYYGTMPLQ